MGVGKRIHSCMAWIFVSVFHCLTLIENFRAKEKEKEKAMSSTLLKQLF